jgi:hypothetical protein
MPGRFLLVDCDPLSISAPGTRGILFALVVGARKRVMSWTRSLSLSRQAWRSVSYVAMACGRLFRTITGVRLDALDRHELRMVGRSTIRGRHSNRPAMFVTNRGRALKPRELSFGRHATAQHVAIQSAGAGSGRRKQSNRPLEECCRDDFLE